MAWDRPQGNYGNRGNSRGGGEDKQRFPNSGALFPSKNRRSESSPDYYGSVLIADDVLDYLVREAEGGNEVMLELSAWSRVTRDNTSITSIKINIPYAVRQEQEGNQSFKPRYPNRGQNARPETRQAPQRGRYEERDERPQRNSYADQSQGTARPMATQDRRRMEDQDRTREFAKGDRTPSFLDDDDEAPWGK